MKKGVGEGAADVLLSSITLSTLKQYESSLKNWWEFAQHRKIDIFNAKTSEILCFLTDCFNKGANYSSLNTRRSAISLISIHDINKDGLISRFLRGVFKQRPTKPKYASTWDITPVLNYIEQLGPLKDLKKKEAAEKVATLLALGMAQRLQSLSLINIENIEKSDSGIRIKITDRIKTSKPGAFQPELNLPFFRDKPNLCVATAVLEYLEYTQDSRGSETKRLFIATMKPFGPVSAQTIGHWIKSMLGKAGINIEQFTAYSTRHAAVSAAYKKGVDVGTIRQNAGWSPNSETFFKFYNRPIQAPNDQFIRAILE